ncbi:OadG family transporter subunit [Rhodovulum visakhapatnamense]|uniref:Oxaloacetate decarboxylase gamma subunit n=1 Tax=Rhodovulum visakhapatnamense TaxID=364297 RepID=A0A4R8FZH7_9RHOB|nr:OadG family transporter subunit [Rhodovulum visakhapatnamense]TDX32567.1 oxaloacetate decarboxylase gamma subunit [Rhodovulum visakhapatnamense]
MLENLSLIGTGFAVVLLVLASLWGACALIGRAFIRAARKAERPVVAPRPPVAPGVPPHHLAAIAAAVAETLGPGHRITRVAAPAHRVDGWPLEGRIETFAAHRIRTGWGPTLPRLGGKTPDIMRGPKP